MVQAKATDKIAIISGLRDKLMEVRNQPEFSWTNNTMNYAVTPQGEPDVKVGAANCSLDFDLWKDLRNPAKVGLYPVSIEQIWEFWAHYHKQKSDDSGRSTIFQLPPTFESARKKYKRVLTVSAMLPLSPEIFKSYNSSILKGQYSPPDIFRKAMTEVEEMLNRSLTRFAFELMQLPSQKDNILSRLRIRLSDLWMVLSSLTMSSVVMKEGRWLNCMMNGHVPSVSPYAREMVAEGTLQLRISKSLYTG